MTINDLLEQKRGLVTEANAIRDRVFNQQNGEWRGDDEAKFDDLTAQAEGVSKTIDRLAKLEDQERSLESADQPKGRKTDEKRQQQPGRPGNPTVEDRAMAFHGWVASGAAERDRLITDQHREAARRCGVSLDAGTFNLRMTQKPLRSLQPEDIRAWEQRLTQVSVVSPDLGGHYTVPDEMMRELEVALLAFGSMRSVASVIRTPGGNPLPFPTLNDTSNTGAIVGEGIDLGEEDVVFNQLVLEAFKYSSKKVPVSWEFLQDNAVNFSGRIGGILGERISRAQNADFTTGDGNSKPKGVIAAATTSSVTTTNSTTITHDNLIDLKHSVDPAYRRNARFMFNDTTLKILKKIRVPQYSGDTTGEPLWRPGLAAGVPDTIDGDPYVINQQVASGANSKAIAYGDFSKYQIREVQDITLLRLNERYAELGIVVFVAWARADGDLLDAGTHPIKYLTMGS